MGRRALPRIPLDIDFSQHLLELESLESPWDPIACFGSSAPLEIEVGSGKGLFLVASAAACRERNFLGIEIAGKYARYVAARLARHQLHNARIIHGDAEVFFRAPGDGERHSRSHLLSRSLVEKATPQTTYHEREFPHRRYARAGTRRSTPFLDRRRNLFPALA